jgi:hypothetical protein
MDARQERDKPQANPVHFLWKSEGNFFTPTPYVKFCQRVAAVGCSIF